MARDSGRWGGGGEGCRAVKETNSLKQNLFKRRKRSLGKNEPEVRAKMNKKNKRVHWS